MSQLIKHNNPVVKRDGFLWELSGIMSDPKFRSFIDQYFDDALDTKTSIMMLKTYSILQSRASKINGKEPSREQMVELMMKAIHNPEFRSAMVAEMKTFMDGDTLPSIE